LLDFKYVVAGKRTREALGDFFYHGGRQGACVNLKAEALKSMGYLPRAVIPDANQLDFLGLTSEFSAFFLAAHSRRKGSNLAVPPRELSAPWGPRSSRTRPRSERDYQPDVLAKKESLGCQVRYQLRWQPNL